MGLSFWWWPSKGALAWQKQGRKKTVEGAKAKGPHKAAL
jgi:hypothetical protein